MPTTEEARRVLENFEADMPELKRLLNTSGMTWFFSSGYDLPNLSNPRSGFFNRDMGLDLTSEEDAKLTEAVEWTTSFAEHYVAKSESSPALRTVLGFGGLRNQFKKILDPVSQLVSGKSANVFRNRSGNRGGRRTRRNRRNTRRNRKSRRNMRR